MPSDDFKAPASLKEGQERLDAKRGELKTIFEEAGVDDTYDYSKVKSVDGDAQAMVANARRLSTR